MDPVSIGAIVVASTSLIAVLGKVLHTFRRNIKSCFGVQFRTPSPSQDNNHQNNNVNIDAINNDAIIHNENIARERFQSIHGEFVFPNKQIRSVEC